MLAKEILIKALMAIGVILIILAIGVVYFGLSSCPTLTVDCPSSIVGVSVFAMLAIGLSLIAIGINEGRVQKIQMTRGVNLQNLIRDISNNPG